MLTRRLVSHALVVAAVLATGAATTSAFTTPSPSLTLTGEVAPIAAAAAPPPDADVGPLFTSGLAEPHTCTASVVASPEGDVIATAAHCLSGSAVGTVFSPGYSAGASPYGTWVVTAAYADPSWLTAQDPQDDVAFLTVAPSVTNSSTAAVQSVVGGATLSVAPTSGSVVTVTGYAEGAQDNAITCTTTTAVTGAYPTFTCGSFPGGTSGGPWITTTEHTSVLAGVIGGLDQGGCTDPTSYTSAFTSATVDLLERAVDGGAGDVLPRAGSSGC